MKADKWGGCCVTWWYHVAPLVRVRIKIKLLSFNFEFVLAMVIDPGMFDKPVLLSTWLAAQEDTACWPNANLSMYSIQPGSAYSPANYAGTMFTTDPSVHGDARDADRVQEPDHVSVVLTAVYRELTVARVRGSRKTTTSRCSSSSPPASTCSERTRPDFDELLGPAARGPDGADRRLAAGRRRHRGCSGLPTAVRRPARLKSLSAKQAHLKRGQPKTSPMPVPAPSHPLDLSAGRVAGVVDSRCLPPLPIARTRIWRCLSKSAGPQGAMTSEDDMLTATTTARGRAASRPTLTGGAAARLVPRRQRGRRPPRRPSTPGPIPARG